MKNIFGQEVEEDVILRDKFIEPPFSVLDTKGGRWQARKRAWLAKGIKSEVGRGTNLTYQIPMNAYRQENMEEEYYEASKKDGTSVFDPALCELIYRWFCPVGGSILDPFAGGSVRGVVAHFLGYKYFGIELRKEQVDSNREQALAMLAVNNQPQWYVGDSDAVLDRGAKITFDFAFSCPPYADLERYSDDPLDLSTMDYADFLNKYRSIIKKTVSLVKPGSYIAWVVGDVRNRKTGYYYDLVSDTKYAFDNFGAGLYNDAILLTMIGTASMRADKQFEASRKLVKVHQNVLIFKKYN